MTCRCRTQGRAECPAGTTDVAGTRAVLKAETDQAPGPDLENVVQSYGSPQVCWRGHCPIRVLSGSGLGRLGRGRFQGGREIYYPIIQQFIQTVNLSAPLAVRRLVGGGAAATHFRSKRQFTSETE